MGSMGAVTAAFAQALERLGCRVEPYRPQIPEGAEQFLPLDRAKLQSALVATSQLDIAIHDDRSLEDCPPSHRWARRNVVLYHGLVGSPGAWLANAEVDLHCANSPYLADVLRSILGYPDWTRRTCLEPRAFGIVSQLALAMPCVDEPEGSLMPHGADLPAAARAALDDGSLWGHALQAFKHDWAATLAILAKANELARERDAPPLRLLVPASDFGPDDMSRAGEMVLPVPVLTQRALFEVMRACHFALACNTVPESFGFYALESVYHGCPVYSNGAGNTRHALPAGHGITVIDDFDEEGRDAAARTLLDDLERPDEMAAQCRRGADVIRERHSRRAFERGVAALLARLERAPPPDPAFETLRIRLGPLVRRYDSETGVLRSDLRSLVLTPEQRARLADLVGRTSAEVLADRAFPREHLDWFFDNGILTLACDSPVP